MANYDNPNGLKPYRTASMNPYTVKSGSSVTKGDILAYVGGVVLPMLFDGTHDAPLGVAAHDASAGEQVLVFDDPGTQFTAQCSGSYTPATHDGARVGFEGTTGVMEVNENATAGLVGRILRQFPVPGSEDTGANARVLVQFVTHARGATSPDVTFDDVNADTLTINGLDVGDLVGTLTNDGAGYTTIADVGAQTSPTAGTGSGADATTFSGAECDALRAEVAACRAAINALLARLETAGISAAA